MRIRSEPRRGHHVRPASRLRGYPEARPSRNQVRKTLGGRFTADVIRETGLSGKSHFYHYFKSKEELGYAVLNRQFERFAERGLAILREPMIDPLERLYLFIDSVVTAQATRPCSRAPPAARRASR